MFLNKIIAFEGRDGVGKTSHINHLSQFLTNNNIPHITTRELANYEPLSSIKKIVVSGDLSPMEELLLVTTARSWHWRNVVMPALSANKLVIMDRFIDSTFAYQHAVQPNYIEYMNREICKCKSPDIVFLIKGEPRRSHKNDAIEHRGDAFFRKVENIYESRVNQSWYVYNTKTPFHSIQCSIEREVMAIFQLKYADAKFN